MIAKLPQWVWIGALALAFNAGLINAVGFLSFTHQGVTHLTGTTTLLGIAVAGGRFGEAAHLATLVGAFVAGAALSGFIIRDSTLHLGRRYGVALLIESALLVVAVPCLHRDNALGDYLASSACGLQNAMMSTYSGAVLRTTHVSGVFTDLGIFLGHLLRGMQQDWRRLRLWLALLGGFAGGGVVGALLFGALAYDTLYVPAALTALVGASYSVYRHLRRTHPARPPSHRPAA
jgi:uncharacterized membrane protein YoaK (UPF0700 family)